MGFITVTILMLARMGKKRNTYGILVRKSLGKFHLQDHEGDIKRKLRWML
jgi:hypothetical protein